MTPLLSYIIVMGSILSVNLIAHGLIKIYMQKRRRP